MEHSVDASVDVNKDSKMRTKRVGPKEGEREDAKVRLRVEVGYRNHQKLR